MTRERALAFLQRLGFTAAPPGPRPPPTPSAEATAPAGTPAVREGADGALELYLYGEVVDEATAGMMQAWGLDGFVSSAGVAHALSSSPKVARVLVNSPGGMVGEGIAVANMVARRKLPAVVDGYALSIASVIIAASPDVTLQPGAMVMVHKPWSGLMGNATALRAEASVLDTHEEAMLDIYASKSRARGYTREDWRAALAGLEEGVDGTWMTGEAALATGIVDRVAPPADGKPSPEVEKGRKNFALRERFAHLPPNLLEDDAPASAAPAKQEPASPSSAEPAKSPTVGGGRVRPKPGAVSL